MKKSVAKLLLLMFGFFGLFLSNDLTTSANTELSYCGYDCGGGFGQPAPNPGPICCGSSEGCYQDLVNYYGCKSICGKGDGHDPGCGQPYPY